LSGKAALVAFRLKERSFYPSILYRLIEGFTDEPLSILEASGLGW
jgi:hypothetical protein